MEWKIGLFWKKYYQMLRDVTFKWDCLTERKENVLVLGPVWSALIMMIIYSPFICNPLHAPICWDFPMGFSSQQRAGLVPGEQPWSGCPGQAALPSSERKCELFVRIQRVSLCPVPVPGRGCQGSGLGPATSFYCVTAADASLPAAASPAFSGCLPGLMAPAVPAGVT